MNDSVLANTEKRKLSYSVVKMKPIPITKEAALSSGQAAVRGKDGGAIEQRS